MAKPCAHTDLLYSSWISVAQARRTFSDFTSAHILQLQPKPTQADVVKEKADKPAIKLSAGLEAFLEKEKVMFLHWSSYFVASRMGQ